MSSGLDFPSLSDAALIKNPPSTTTEFTPAKPPTVSSPASSRKNNNNNNRNNRKSGGNNSNSSSSSSNNNNNNKNNNRKQYPKKIMKRAAPSAEEKEEQKQKDFNQYFIGTASLIQQLDKRIMVLLHDGMQSGKKLFGYLRSFDQFSNVILQDCVEREFVGDEYGEIHRGLYVVRGENILLLSELDSSKDEVNPALKKIEWKQIVKKRKEIDVSISIE